jgi:hypothetical protein
MNWNKESKPYGEGLVRCLVKTTSFGMITLDYNVDTEKWYNVISKEEFTFVEGIERWALCSDIERSFKNGSEVVWYFFSDSFAEAIINSMNHLMNDRISEIPFMSDEEWNSILTKIRDNFQYTLDLISDESYDDLSADRAKELRKEAFDLINEYYDYFYD